MTRTGSALFHRDKVVCIAVGVFFVAWAMVNVFPFLLWGSTGGYVWVILLSLAQ